MPAASCGVHAAEEGVATGLQVAQVERRLASGDDLRAAELLAVRVLDAARRGRATEFGLLKSIVYVARLRRERGGVVGDLARVGREAGGRARHRRRTAAPAAAAGGCGRRGRAGGAAAASAAGRPGRAMPRRQGRTVSASFFIDPSDTLLTGVRECIPGLPGQVQTRRTLTGGFARVQRPGTRPRARPGRP